MVWVVDLWLPIVLSAIFVFVASSIIHMALGYHRTDFDRLPNEEALLEAMRREGIAPGAYAFPFAPSPQEMGAPETVAKYEKGPVGMMTVLASGVPALGKHLGQWFAFCLLVSVFVAYLAGRTMAGGEEYLQVFRVVATAAFMAYGFGEIADSIWRGQPWGNTVKGLIDGMVYALVTAGTFGWLWPEL